MTHQAIRASIKPGQRLRHPHVSTIQQQHISFNVFLYNRLQLKFGIQHIPERKGMTQDKAKYSKWTTKHNSMTQHVTLLIGLYLTIRV
jgi:hypothetical protein